MGWPNCFVSFLRLRLGSGFHGLLLCLLRLGSLFRPQKAFTLCGRHLLPSLFRRLLTKNGLVRSHLGDMSCLLETLRDLHGPLRIGTKERMSLLLKSASNEGEWS